MTVTYTSEVATCRGFSRFLKLLARWRGSIYKLVWIDLLIFLIFYYLINLMYRFVLNVEQRKVFENLVEFCGTHNNFIPLSFVLGFYVSIVMARWWCQYTAIPMPDAIAVFVSATVHGHDERGRVMRRTIMRYVCLCLTMLFTRISPRVKKRFPSLDHLVDGGLMQASERDVISKLDQKFPNHSKHWLPIVWAASIITRARREGRIRDDFAVKTMIDELNKFRGQCALLTKYDVISVPLVYTQVVTLAVYSYFLTTLIGHQVTDNNKNAFDMYVPIFTMLQFFFYVGWLKVAESLINPFGDDDDDFEVNWMVDRNLQVSYIIVDEMHHEHPELIRDQYWDDVFPQELPHTKESRPFRGMHPLPSTANIAVPSPALTTVGDGNVFDNSYNKVSNDFHLDSGPFMFSANARKSASLSDAFDPTLAAMSRANSVSNILKRLFSRENSRNDSVSGSMTDVNLLNSNKHLFVSNDENTKKIIDQVIEEVDEQMTIQARREAEQLRPHIKNIFAESQPAEGLPTEEKQPATAVPTPGDTMVDLRNESDFLLLKKKREEERLSKLNLNLPA